jgi:hypothetical protein
MLCTNKMKQDLVQPICNAWEILCTDWAGRCSLCLGTAAMATADAMQNFNGFRLRAYPLIGILLGGGWALKFKFAELSMLQTKTKEEGWTKSYVAGISGSTFGVGISKNFDFRKNPPKDDN